MDVNQALLAALLIVLLGGAISGLAGFGFGLVTVPFLLLIFEPPAVVSLVKILTLATTWVIIVDAWREVQARQVLALLPWAVVGLIAGIAMLTLLDAALIKLLAGIVVTAFALVLLRGVPQPRLTTAWATPLSGFMSGALSTSTGLTGPPVVLLFTLRGVSMHAFRTSISAYFLILDAVSLPALLYQGAVTASDLRTAALLAPAALGGRLLGVRLVRRVSPLAFRRATLGLLLLAGLIGTASAIATLV